MTVETPTPWISLNATYYIAPIAAPTTLLDDADLMLESAYGMAHSLSETLGDAKDANPGYLSSALHGLATLIELGQRCAQEAHTRMLATQPALTGAECG